MPELLKTVQKRGKGDQPRRTLLYGTHGIGKSTFASRMPGHLIFDLEDGLNNIVCDATPKLGNMNEVMGWITELYEQDHKYKVICIDTIDFLERIIWKEVCREGNKKALDDFGFGKGYKLALASWGEFLEALDYLREKQGMAVLLLAHATTEKYENPETEPYDRYCPRIHKSASQLVQQWCDEVFFASHKVFTVKDDIKGGERSRGISSTDRVIRTEERAAFLAKSRLAVPQEFPLDYTEYKKFLPTNQKKETKSG